MIELLNTDMVKLNNGGLLISFETVRINLDEIN